MAFLIFPSWLSKAMKSLRSSSCTKNFHPRILGLKASLAEIFTIIFQALMVSDLNLIQEIRALLCAFANSQSRNF
ncbi:CLUMA_CG013424, isoform A [Clunio marinus]|uniref:CLUMA_CG013424, isoform A n=1 Tax=Clunio marinus TaxID=568069 RepID=A0A1J1IKS6_9DIPT|nr:CLUMA_CG013424, isoform A [Clunio marinus]